MASLPPSKKHTIREYQSEEAYGLGAITAFLDSARPPCHVAHVFPGCPRVTWVPLSLSFSVRDCSVQRRGDAVLAELASRCRFALADPRSLTICQTCRCLSPAYLDPFPPVRGMLFSTLRIYF